MEIYPSSSARIAVWTQSAGVPPPRLLHRSREHGALHGDLAKDRQLLRHAAALALRRSDPDVAKLRGGPRQTRNALRLNAVIIGDQ